jgi:hypothetical protein
MYNTELLKKFSELPDVLINKILDYTNIVIFRHGKYIDRINKNDIRYIKISNIPRPIKVCNNKILLKLINSKPYGYFIYYVFYDNFSVIEVKFAIKKEMCNERYFDIRTTNKFIFDINSRYSKLIDYSL